MLNKRFLVLVLIFLFASCVRPAFAINVLTFDESRIGTETNQYGSINFNFVTGGAFSTLRGDLVNPANFGPGGVVGQSVSFLSTVPVLTSGVLANADVFILPYSTSLDSAESAALGGFIQSGGGLVMFGNWAAEGFAEDVFGAARGPAGSAKAWVTDPTSPIVNGPFGTVLAPLNDPLYLMWNQSFASLGPYGHEVLKNDLGIFGATFTYGSGRAVFFTDEEFLMDPPAVPNIAAPNLSDRSERLFLNSFAYVTPNRQNIVPEPATLALLGSGLVGVLLKRKKRRI